MFPDFFKAKGKLKTFKISKLHSTAYWNLHLLSVIDPTSSERMIVSFNILLAR